MNMNIHNSYIYLIYIKLFIYVYIKFLGDLANFPLV